MNVCILSDKRQHTAMKERQRKQVKFMKNHVCVAIMTRDDDTSRQWKLLPLYHWCCFVIIQRGLG